MIYEFHCTYVYFFSSLLALNPRIFMPADHALSLNNFKIKSLVLQTWAPAVVSALIKGPAGRKRQSHVSPSLMWEHDYVSSHYLTSEKNVYVYIIHLVDLNKATFTDVHKTVTLNQNFMSVSHTLSVKGSLVSIIFVAMKWKKKNHRKGNEYTHD